MSQETNTVTIRIMDRDFKIKCPQSKIMELKESAGLLENKIREAYRQCNEKVIGIEKLTIVAALNISHELITLQKNNGLSSINKRIHKIKNKIEETLASQS
jgi:cell division protein ZapA